MRTSSIWISLILSELIVATLLGYVFMRFIMESYNFLSERYFSGIVRAYGIINLIFFISVLTIGSIGAKKLAKSHLVKRAVYLSIIFWIGSLILYAITFSFFSYTLNWRILPISIFLIGIVSGFNFGLISKTKSE